MCKVNYVSHAVTSVIKASSLEECFKQLASIERISKIMNTEFKIVDEIEADMYEQWKTR